jgi:hypothetical protein
MHQVSKILFRHETLHVSGIFCAHHQELSAVHVAIGMFHAGYVAAAEDSQVGTPKFLFCHETLHVLGIYCDHHEELSAVHVANGMFHSGYVAAA